MVIEEPTRVLFRRAFEERDERRDTVFDTHLGVATAHACQRRRRGEE